MQRSVLGFTVGIYIQLKMPFFVEVIGLKKIMTSPGRDRDWAKTAVGITGLSENFVRDRGIEEPYLEPSFNCYLKNGRVFFF